MIIYNRKEIINLTDMIYNCIKTQNKIIKTQIKI